jgi:hypothetical protein
MAKGMTVCNQSHRSREQGFMAWLSSLVMALFVALAVPAPAHIMTSVGSEYSPSSCSTCCNSETRNCGSTLAACERICSAAVLPTALEVPKPRQTNSIEEPLSNPLSPFSEKPTPPPPRVAAHLSNTPSFSGE